MARPEALLLLFVLVFAPLAFGAVEPWSQAVAGGAALAGFAIALRRRTHGSRLRLQALPGALPLLLFLGALLLQLLPLPPALLRALSPAAHARWAAALGDAVPLPWVPLSLDPLATLRELVRFAACAALYALTVQLLARRERLRAVTTALAVFGAALAFEAILQHLVGQRRLLFVRPAPAGHPFGPFVNRNHYANLMAMLTPVLFGLFLGRGLPAGSGTLRTRLADLVGHRESSVRLLLGFAALLSAASLVVSLSRGATVAVVAALLVFGGGLIARRTGARRSVTAALFFYAFAVFVGWFGWERVAARFEGLRGNPELVDSVRAGLWRDALRMAGDYPVFGAGAGSFERLYPAYRTVPGRFAIAHAHNDYLELLAGAGALGLGLYAWFVGAVLLATARSCRRRHGPPALYLAFGALAGCAAFLVHGAGDFSLAIGANALFFVFLLGLAVSAANTLGREEERASLLESVRLPAFFTHAATLVAAVAILGQAADLAARHAWRLAGEQTARSAALLLPPASQRMLIAQAARLQPLEGAYPAALARVAAREGRADEALALTRRALRRLPLAPETLVQHASLLGARGDPAAARRLLDAAIALDPAAARLRETAGSWLLANGDRETGAARLREALALDPRRAPRILSLLVLAGFADEEIAALVPPEPAALRQLARYAEATGNPRLALGAWRRILELNPADRQAAGVLRRLEAPPQPR